MRNAIPAFFDRVQVELQLPHSCPRRSQEMVSMQCCGEKLILSLPKLQLAAQTKVDHCKYLLGLPTWKMGGSKHPVPSLMDRHSLISVPLNCAGSLH